MIFERVLICCLYTPNSIYFTMIGTLMFTILTVPSVQVFSVDPNLLPETAGVFVPGSEAE